jgi:hypothetical protein
VRDHEAFRKRMALSRQIRAVMAETFPGDPKRAQRWLAAEGQQLMREAERAKRPLETFPADPIAEAF